MDSFPDDMGKELGGKTFAQVFETNPKIIEFVSATWTDSYTGLFKKFRIYVNARLEHTDEKEAHVKRCRDYVKGQTVIPRYLNKYR